MNRPVPVHSRNCTGIVYFIIWGINWGTCEGTCMFFYLDARRNEPIHACSIVGPDTCCRCIFTVNVLTSLWLASSICGLHCCSVIYIHEPRRESGRDGVGAASVMPSWSSACTHEGGHISSACAACSCNLQAATRGVWAPAVWSSKWLPSQLIDLQV